MSSSKSQGDDENAVHIDIDETEDNGPVVGLSKLQSKKSILIAIADHEEKNKNDSPPKPEMNKNDSPPKPEMNKNDSPPKPPKIQQSQSPQSPQSIVSNDGTRDHEVFNLASIIFTHADLDHSGVIYIDEFMESTNLSMNISKAILRSMKCIDSFQLDSLYQFIKTLKHGTLEEKVQILHAYIDENSDGGINEKEFNESFKIKNATINAKLGFDGNPDYKLTYDNLLSIFKTSPIGEDVINSFCNEILEVLSKVAIENIRDSKMKRTTSKESNHKSYYNRVIEYCINFAKNCVGSKKNRFLSVLVLLQLFLFLYYFCYYYVYLGKPQELAIAKGFGLNLRILSVGMFFTMCRTTLGNLYLVAYLDKLIPLGLNLEIHSFIGISVLFHSIGHVFAHISYEYIRTDGGPRATVLQKSLTNGGWSYRLNGGDGITGYILLGIILFMSTTAMCRGLSSKFYAIFYHLHIVGYLLWITFLYLHVYSLWRWWLAILVLYMGDLCYDLIFLTTVSTLSLSRPGPDGVTFLSLYSTNHPEAGSYYRIKVPSLSLTEWHSFSFAGNSSSNHLKFFIASAGDWTSALHSLVSDPSRRDKALVIVIGPYKAPAEKLFRSHKYEGRAKNCLVASGIGITPFLSCIATDIMNGLNAESNKDTFDALFHEDLHAVRQKTTKNDFTEEEDFAEDDETRILHVVWSIREIGELMFFIEYIYQLIKLQDNLREKIVTIDIYLTGLGSIHDPKYLIAQTFFSLIVGEKTTSNMNIFYSRPNFDNIVQKIKPRSMYYCGGALIREMLDPICAKYNIKFRPESFDDGGTFVKDLKVFASRLYGKYYHCHKE